MKIAKQGAIVKPSTDFETDGIAIKKDTRAASIISNQYIIDSPSCIIIFYEFSSTI